MKYYLILIYFILFITTLASANPIRVAVIDTGIKRPLNVPICPTDNKTFFGDDINDEHGHGSVMAILIDSQAKGADYCLVIVKAYGYTEFNNKLSNKFEEALEYVSKLKVDFVNISGGGPGFDKVEKYYIDLILKSGAKIVVAAGNEGKDLDKDCDYYPACYSKYIIVVGGKDFKDGNYGKIVSVYAPYKVTFTNGKTMTGTSVSTAIVTGNLVRVMDKARKKHIPNIDPKRPFKTGIIELPKKKHASKTN